MIIPFLVRSLLLGAAFVLLGGCDQLGQQQSERSVLSGDEKPAERAVEKPVVAVLGFNDFLPDRAVQDSKGLPDDLAARVIEHLTRSNRFQVLERNALRKVVLEQRFGRNPKQTYLDRILDAAIERLPEVGGDTARAVGGLADYNDLIKDYQDLGTAVGADYLVFAVLEKAREKQNTLDLPYSSWKIAQNVRDARVRLRIIEVESGRIVAADSFRFQERAYNTTREENERDGYSLLDDLGVIVAREVLDVISPAEIVSDDPLVVNRGRNDGYREGEELTVLRAGKAIQDSTGVELERIMTPVGRVKIVKAQDLIAVVTPVAGEARKGDRVRSDRLLGRGSPGQRPVRAATGAAPGAKGPLRLAVGKFRIACRVPFTPRHGEERLRDQLLVKLSHSNRFQLLERQQMEQLLDEKLFDAVSSDRDLAPYLAELADADFFVLGSVDRFDVALQTRKIPYVDRMERDHYGLVEASLRIVDVHDGKVVGAEKISIRELLPADEPVDSLTAYDALFDKMSEAMVTRLVQRIYPMKVLAVAPGGTVYLNRGRDGGLNRGDRLGIYRPGQEMIDPDSGLSFGRMETKVAVVEIEEVEPFRSRAKIVEGGVQAGDIAKMQLTAAERPKVPIPVRRPNF